VTLVRLGCGIDRLSTLQNEVDLLLSDLPSGETRAAFDRPIDLDRFWSAAWPALTPHGSVVLMASHIAFAAKLIASQPHAFKYDLVWQKSIAGGFLNASHRPLRAHEFVFARAPASRCTYHPQMRGGAEPIPSRRDQGRSGESYGQHGRYPPIKPNSSRPSSGENYNTAGAGRSRAGATNRFPWFVLSFPSVGTTSKDRRHPQQKPEPLLRWLVETYSNVCDLVVDPFAGSVSTGLATLAAGRQFAGWDSDPRWGATP
jgi:site-specific DNA-methyltransferase (adenine-specific)